MTDVSVIITTYKRSLEILSRAVESVLNQSYSEFELIVVDDSPSDFEERDKIKEYILNLDDSRVRLVQHEKNKGGCVARNTGIANSTGSLIAFLDDDDVWHSDKLEKQLAKMSQGDYGLVYCRQRIINEINNTEEYPKRKYYEGRIFDELILTNFVGSTSFVLVKRECFDKVGMFDVELPASQDFDMWLRIAKEYNIGFVDEALVDYYIHKGESITGNLSKKLTAIEKFLESNEEYLKTHPKQKSIRYLKAAPYFAVNKKYGKMFGYSFKGVIANPANIKFNTEYLAKTARAVFLKKV